MARSENNNNSSDQWIGRMKTIKKISRGTWSSWTLSRERNLFTRLDIASRSKSPTKCIRRRRESNQMKMKTSTNFLAGGTMRERDFTKGEGGAGCDLHNKIQFFFLIMKLKRSENFLCEWKRKKEKLPSALLLVHQPRREVSVSVFF